MKAIKLASVFAVSAVAAAVSTTTIAADAVFSGEAGIAYKMTDAGDTLDGTDLAEVEFSVDTGLVYAEVEIATDSASSDDASVDIEKIYVKNGAVSFGKFDGSLSDGAFFANDEVLGSASTASEYAAIRYVVMDGLTVALEGSDAVDADGNTELGAAFSYEVAASEALTLGLSGGSVGDDTAFGLGVTFSADALTLNVGYSGGEVGGADKSQMEVEAQFAVSEQLTLIAEYGNDLEAETTGTFFKAAYAMGGITYYVETEAGDFDEYTEIGAKATF